jgi:hypothetical protein
MIKQRQLFLFLFLTQHGQALFPKSGTLAGISLTV